MSNRKIELRLGSIGDARKNFEIRYRAIHEIAFNDYAENILNSWGRLCSEAELTKREQRFNLRVEQRENVNVVAEIDNQIVGFGEISLSHSELTALYVNPDFKRQGVGTAIIENLKYRAKEAGITDLTLHSSLTAVPFYERNRFRQVKHSTHRLATGESMACVIMKITL